ncbi:MAG: hypothetical protein HC882_00260 [Acidobacteria bacterium]|nr:hypothetical protein [Acidobacteriota bacterium]
MTYRRQLQGRGQAGRRIRNSGGGVPCIPPSFLTNPVATAPTGMLIGETVQTTDGTFVGTGVVVTYQWRRDGVNIGGATMASYVLVAADLLVFLDCVVTLTGACGVASADSNDLEWTPAEFGARVVLWTEARNPGNTVLAGEYDVQIDLGPAGNDMIAGGPTTRPDSLTSVMLSGGVYADYNGTTDWMRALNTAVYKSVFQLYQQVVNGVPGRPIASWGASNQERLRQGAVVDRIGFIAAGATEVLSTSNVTDRYFHLIAGIDVDAANQRVIVWAPDILTRASDNTGANANARGVGVGTSSVGAFVTGTFPTRMNEALDLRLTDVPTEQEIDQIAAYARRNMVDLQALPTTTFVGTRITQADAQPRPYPLEHEGQSGNTVSACANRLVGTWVGADVTIGSPSDPGPGNRGAMETLATTRALTNLVPVVLVGTNDASSGPVPIVAYQMFIERMWAVAGVGPGGIQAIGLCELLGRTFLAPAAQNEVIAFNALLPGLVATLNGLGIPAFLVPLFATFNTGTMLLPDGLHLNLLGCQTVAQGIFDELTLQGLVSANTLVVPVGDSITEGGPNLVPQATAQYRPWLAKLL